MDTGTLLRARLHEMSLEEDDIAVWAGKVDVRFVQALLSTLLAFEEALRELAG